MNFLRIWKILNFSKLVYYSSKYFAKIFKCPKIFSSGISLLHFLDINLCRTYSPGITVFIPVIYFYAPNFYLNTYFLESYASVEENEKIGTFISFVTITDGDMGSNGRFVAAVRPKDKFKLEADSYGSDSLILMTKKVFDREEKEFHNATITACDEGTPKK